MNDKNNFEQNNATNEIDFAPKKKPPTLLVVFISILVTAVVVGLVMCFVTAKLYNNKIDSLQKEIETLSANSETRKNETESQTADWQIYRNEEYGYEIKYPKDWFVYDDACSCECAGAPVSQVKSYNNIRVTSFSRPSECGYSGLGGRGIQIKIQATDKLKSLNDWINNIKLVDSTMKVKIVKDVSIGGIAGKELTLSCDCLIGADFFRIIEENNAIYEFSVSTQDVDLNNYQSTIDQIISTFKFIDNRILLTPENIGQYNNPVKDAPASCNEKFDASLANATVTYSNDSKGISFKLPYNSNWGSSRYRLNPYDEYASGLHFGLDKYDGWVNFGPMGVFEGCAWARSYALGFLPAKSADQTITEMKDKNLMILKPYKAIIDGLEVVKYEEGGMCSYPTILVIGKKYNYELRPICSVSGKFEALEDIVKTIKFLD